MPTNPTLVKLINYFFKNETPIEKINSKSDVASTAAITEHWDHMEYLQKRLEDLLLQEGCKGFYILINSKKSCQKRKVIECLMNGF